MVVPLVRVVRLQVILLDKLLVLADRRGFIIKRPPVQHLDTLSLRKDLQVAPGKVKSLLGRGFLGRPVKDCRGHVGRNPEAGNERQLFLLLVVHPVDPFLLILIVYASPYRS